MKYDNPTEFDDPSEPIYTDPSMFERSRLVSKEIIHFHQMKIIKIAHTFHFQIDEQHFD